MINLINSLTNFASNLEDSKPYFATASLTLAGGALVGPWEMTRIIGVTTLAGVICQTASTYIIRQKSKSVYSSVGPFEWMQAICQASPISALAGTILATLACIPCAKLPLKVTAKQLAPYLALSTALMLLVSHIRGQRSAEKKKSQLANVLNNAKEERCYLKYRNTFIKSTTQMFMGGTVLLSIAIVAARVGVINLSSPFKLLTIRPS